MADSYVCSKAKIKCSFGDKISTLTVWPDRTIWLTGEPQANISDHIPLRNIAPFGKCHTVAYPATGAATAANQGKLTPMPCVPNTPFPWMGGKNDVILKGYPALMKTSTCKCIYGGTISITFDGQKIKTLTPLITEQQQYNTIVNTPYNRSLKVNYTPSFSFNQELKGVEAEKAKSIFKNEISNLFNSCQVTSNWLQSNVCYTSKLNEETINESEIIQESTNSDTLLLKGYISNTDIEIRQEEYSEEFVRESGDLLLLAFDAIPLIRNTKASLTFIIDAFVAGLSITFSVGVDNNLRRYLQLEIDSWIGGDYSDLVDFVSSKAHTSNPRKYTKIYGKLLKRCSKRLRVLQIKPKYSTAVPQPLYDWLDCGAYANLDFKLDKLLQVEVGSEGIQNVTEIWENGYIKISSTLNLPGLDLSFGWNSKNILEENYGFFIDINFTKLPDNNTPITPKEILKKDKEFSKKSPFERLSIYQPEKFDASLVAKIGSKWSYTWQLENILEEHNIPKF